MTAFPGPDSSAPAPATDSTGLGTDTVAGTVSGDGTTGATWLDRYTDAVMNTFGTPGRVLVRGQGVHIWDADGKEYTDLLAGRQPPSRPGSPGCLPRTDHGRPGPDP